MVQKLKSLSLVLLIAVAGLVGADLALDSPAHAFAAARVTWKGNADARWSNPANWDGGVVPGPSDIVQLTGSANTQIDPAFSGTVAGIVLAPGFSGTVRLDRDLQLRGEVVIAGGTFGQGEHALTAKGWTQTNGTFVGGSAPLTITGAATVRGGTLLTPSALMRVHSLNIEAPGLVRLGENGKLELTGDGTPLTGNGLLDTGTNTPNSVEMTGRATTDLFAAGPVKRGQGDTGTGRQGDVQSSESILRDLRVLRGRFHLPGDAPQSPGATTSTSSATADALTLASGENNLRSAVVDATGTYAYFGTSTKPGMVVKVRLADFTRVGMLKMASGEDRLDTAVMDAANGYAYFATYTSPGKIIKVRLSDFTRIAALKLNSGESQPRGSVIDPAQGYAYFATFTSPGKVIKVRLSDFTRVKALTLNSGENDLFAAVIDPGAGYAYFGTRTNPGIIVKVRLSDLTRVAALHFTGEQLFHTASINPAGGYAYFGTYTATGIVYKIRLSDFAVADALTLNPGEGNLRSSTIDLTHGVVYFGSASLPGMVIGVRLSDFSRLNAVTLDPGEDQLRSAVMDPASQFVYFGTSDSPGKVVKLPTGLQQSGTSATFNPVADAYVDANHPSANYGNATQLRVQTSPVQRSYLRFDVSGLTGNVTRALLRLYTDGSQGPGYTVQREVDKSWNESAITYNNAPAVGAVLGTSRTGNDAAWTAVDVTTQVTGNGTYSFALTGSDTNGLGFASRESANPPQLVITTDSQTSTSTPTATPTGSSSPTNTPTSTPLPSTATPTATPSPTTSATVPSTQASFVPVADAHVNANYPNTNYGAATELIAQGSPQKIAYLRFTVSGLSGSVSRATLKLYAITTQSGGYTVKQVTDNRWDEMTISYSNAPPVGGTLGSSGPIAANTWTSLDVTPYISGNGTFSLALTASSSNKTGFASRESGANAPQLVVETSGSATVTATAMPTASLTPTNVPTATPFTPTNTPTATPTIVATATPAATATSSPGPSTNLLVDPGFELDMNGDGLPDDWTSWANFTRSSAVVHSGNYAGRFQAANGSSKTVKQRAGGLSAGATYRFSGWVNVPPPTGSFALKLKVSWINSSNSVISSSTIKSYTAPTSGWNQATASLIAPAGAVSADVKMVVSNLNATIYVDDMSLAP